MQREWAPSITERSLPVADKNLADILGRFVVTVSVPDGENAKFFKYFDKYNVPLLDIKLVSKIVSVPPSVATITERLSPVKSLFKFNPNLLTAFLSSLCKESVEFVLSTNVLFYNVIAWLANPNIKEFIQSFNELILAIYNFKDVLAPQLYYYIISAVSCRFFDVGILPFPNSLIKTIFTEVNEYNFDLTVSVLNSTVLNRDNESTIYLTNLINASVSISPEQFSKFDFQILVSTLYQYMCEFDDTALSILSTLAAVKVDNSLLEATTDLTAILLNKVKIESLPKIKPVESELSKIDMNTTTQEISFNVGLNDTFPDGLNPLPPSYYESKEISFETLLSAESMRIIKSVIVFLSRAADDYADVFFLAFVERVTEDNFPIFLYILTNIRGIKITDKIFVKLFSAFQPGVTVYNRCDNFDLVNFYRKNVLHIFSIHSPNLVSKLLIFNEPHPFLFADIIGRIQIKLSHFDLNTLIDETTLSTVIKVTTMLNDLYNNGVEKLASQQAMAGIFIYLFAILENKDTAAKCFVSPVFASGFLSRVLEPSMQKPIVTSMHTFLTEYTDDNTSALLPLVEFICGILGVCRTLPKEERFAGIVIDSLSCVNDSIIHNSSLASIFAPILVPATNFLTEQPSAKLLGEVLYLCSLLVSDSSKKPFNVTQEEAVLLSAATRASEGDVLSEATISGLLNIVSSSRAATTKAMFIIKQPIMINVLFSALKNEQQFKEIVELFNQLCHHSLHNCRACHEGELDLLLLEMIRHFGEDFEFRNMTFSCRVSPETINSLVLPTATFIASFICSPQIAMEFISIIKPMPDRSFSDFAESTMNAIGSSLGLASQYPKTVTPLGESGTYVEITGVKASHLNSGFTVQFWLQVDCPAALLSQRCPTIFQIEDSQGVYFRLHVSGSSIVCNIMQSAGLSFAALASNLPSGKWTLYTLVVTFNQKGAQVSFTNSGKSPSSFSVSLHGFHDGNVSFKIGGVSQGEDGQMFDCRLGDLWFFAEPLDKKKISELNSMGARASDVGVLALFSYPVSVVASGIAAVPHRSKPVHLQNLQEIFCAKLLDFIPFFSFLDTMPAHFPEQLIDLIQCLIPLVKEAGTYNLFSLIGSLLMKAPHSKLTYNLYLKFFGIIENCSITELVKELIKRILFNPELWCVCEATHLQRIVSHWASGLFSTSPSIFMNIVSISDVLVIMRLYFWYSPLETELIRGMPKSERPRPANLDVELCRASLSKLIFSMALFKFQVRDAIVIVSHCSTCPETKQVLNLMNMLIDIAKAREKFAFPVNISRLVYHQLKPSSEDRFITAVKLLYSLSESDFFVHHLQPILSLINGSYVTKKLYDVMVEALPQYHLFFPICSLLAVSLGIVDDFVPVLETIELTDAEALITVKNELWSIWLLLLVINGSSKVRKCVIDLIIRIVFVNPQMRTFDDVFILIDFFAAVTDFEIEKFARKLTTSMAMKIVEIGDPKLCSSFSKRCIKYLLFRINGTETSDALYSLFESSPFSLFDVTASSSQTLKVFSLKTYQEIKAVFEKDVIIDCYYFMFRLGDDGKIRDKALFDATCALFDKMTFIDEELKFWKKYLTCMKDPSLITQGFAQEMNHFLNVYYVSMNRQFISAISSFRKTICAAIKEGEENCINAFLSLQVKEIALASNDIDLYEQGLSINAQFSSRLIRRIARNNINSSSPWSSICKACGYSKSFVFCRSLAQPLLKFNCTYNSALECEVKEINTNAIHSFDAFHVRIKGVEKILFNVYHDFVRIQKNDKFTDISFAEIHSVLLRNRLHRPNSLEFITKDGKSYLIDFTPNMLSTVLTLLMKFPIQKLQTVSQQNFFANHQFTKKWVNGEISNFEYLMKLNLFSGRTFHDASLYPIFPWIITDFTSEKLDLSSEKSFRDLSKPVTNQKGFMYMTAPMNPTYVKHFLGKIRPFDSIQDLEAKFSVGEFKSIEESYKAIIGGPNTVELPPEFYYSPEYFKGIELPKWSSSNYEFVYLNRVALESDYVSERLNKWIDLIFGCYSRGVDEYNIFNPILFEDVWQQWKVTDRATIEASLKVAGHMPPMIFSQPHPQKIIPKQQTPKNTVPFNYYLDRHDLVSTSLASRHNSSLVYFSVCSNGEIVRFTINFDVPQKSSMFTYEKTVKSPSSSLTVPLEGCVAIIDPTTGTLLSCCDKIIKESNIDICSHTVFAASDVNQVIYTSSDGVIGIWENEKEKKKADTQNVSETKVRNYVYQDYVTSIGFSKKFSIVVAGTKNGTIVANTLRGSFVFNTDVGNAPDKILVTKLWGFVLATIPMANEIVLLSVNGEIIKRKETDFTISSWCTWDEKGRDYVCIADDKGRIRVFDAFNVDTSNVIFNCRCSVTTIDYIDEMHAFGVITSDGHCRLIPRTSLQSF